LGEGSAQPQLRGWVGSQPRTPIRCPARDFPQIPGGPAALMPTSSAPPRLYGVLRMASQSHAAPALALAPGASGPGSMRGVGLPVVFGCC